MKRVLVYDWPTRIFHWLFAALFIGAFVIAKTIDDDSPIYPIHMLFGMTLMLSVVLRFIWGFVGSRYAQFSSFSLNPLSLMNYFKDMLLSKKTDLELGHNPASSWAALFMMACVPVLAVTGYLMTQKINKDFYEEIHELTATLFAITVAGHVLGVVIHSIRHRDMIALSMINGTKQASANEAGISKSYAVIGFVFVATVGLFGFYLKQNYDTQTRTLNLLGKQLQLGENENEENEIGQAAENEKSGENESGGDQDGDD